MSAAQILAAFVVGILGGTTLGVLLSLGMFKLGEAIARWWYSR